MGLLPIGQPPENNCYDCFCARKDAVMIKVGLASFVWLGLVFGLVLRSGLMSGL